MLRRLLTVAIAGGLLVSMPGAAQAATWAWNSRSAPLTAYSAGSSGTRLGQGYGSVTLTGRVSSSSYWIVSYTGRGYLRDLRPGNNSVYWENLVQVLGESNPDANPVIKKQSTRWNGSSWRLFTKTAGLVLPTIDRRADIHRKVCEDRRLASDPCHGGWRSSPMSF